MALKGKTEPRIATPPLRKLTRLTSQGYEFIDWCENALAFKLLPWQKHLAVHAMERKAGTKLFRFRTVLVIVARQNGKSTFINLLALFWMIHGVESVLMTSSSLDVARESWEIGVALAEDHPEAVGQVKARRQLGDTQLKLFEHGARYKIHAASARGGRGLSAARVVEDELRLHKSWDAHAALDYATLAHENAQTWLLSNAGTQESVVLNQYRNQAISGEFDDLGIFEWSAPENAEIDDPEAWAQANPSLGYTISEAALREKMKQPAAIFKNESLCIPVLSEDEIVSAGAWASCLDPGTLTNHKAGVALGFDASTDLRHITLVAAAVLPDGRVRVETVAAWTSMTQVRAELPDLLAKIKPRSWGWAAGGPSQALCVDLRASKGGQELSSQAVVSACMGLAEQISASRIAQSADELLAAHILGAKRLQAGDGWRFSRRDGGHCDAAYATAIAVQLARQVPRPMRLKLITARSTETLSADV